MTTVWDWHPADIIAALKKQGTSLSAVSRHSGLASSTLTSALNRHWPKGKRSAADRHSQNDEKIYKQLNFRKKGFPFSSAKTGCNLPPALRCSGSTPKLHNLKEAPDSSGDGCSFYRCKPLQTPGRRTSRQRLRITHDTSFSLRQFIGCHSTQPEITRFHGSLTSAEFQRLLPAPVHWSMSHPAGSDPAPCSSVPYVTGCGLHLP